MTDGSPPKPGQDGFNALERRAEALAAAAAARQRNAPATPRQSPARPPRRGWIILLILAVVGIVAGAIVAANDDDAVRYEGQEPERTSTTLDTSSTTDEPNTTDTTDTTETSDTMAPPTTLPPTSTPPPPVPPPPDPPAVETLSEHTVVVGESFWGIAEQEAGAGTSPTTAEVGSYWAELVAANSDRLVEPGNPDLLLPGQVLVLPASPSRP
ncbi:MAG: LysM domain-containing protein [Acidimicrobiales bacterium]